MEQTIRYFIGVSFNTFQKFDNFLKALKHFCTKITIWSCLISFKPKEPLMGQNIKLRKSRLPYSKRSRVYTTIVRQIVSFNIYY